MERADDLNEERLRMLGRFLANLSLVETVQYFPAGKEDRVVADLETSYYPDVVDSSRLELRVRLNGDFNFQYFEDWSGEQWSCRWDRHPNTHNTREHHSSLANTHSNTEQLRFTGELRRNTFDTGQKHGFQTPWTAYSQ